jgi:hypothetical protein
MCVWTKAVRMRMGVWTKAVRMRMCVWTKAVRMRMCVWTKAVRMRMCVDEGGADADGCGRDLDLRAVRHEGVHHELTVRGGARLSGRERREVVEEIDHACSPRVDGAALARATYGSGRLVGATTRSSGRRLRATRRVRAAGVALVREIDDAAAGGEYTCSAMRSLCRAFQGKARGSWARGSWARGLS